MSKFGDWAISLVPRLMLGFDSLFNSFTGAGLTGAQTEQNKYNSAEAERAYERTLELYEKYNSPKAQINSMLEAGVNPFSVGGVSSSGSSVPSASASSVQSADPLSAILAMVRLSMEKKANDALVDKTKAETEEIRLTLPWDMENLKSSVAKLEMEIESGNLTIMEQRYNLDHMLPLMKDKLKADLSLTSQQENTLWAQMDKAVNESIEIAQRVEQNRDLWPWRKKYERAQAIVADFDASIAEIASGDGDSSDLLQSFTKILFEIVMK